MFVCSPVFVVKRRSQSHSCVGFVVFCAGELNHWVKYTNWEMDAKVPLLVHHPKASHTWGLRTSSLIESVDHYPTFAELAGVPVDVSKESIEGFSYASLFAENAHPDSTVWTSQYNASFTQYPRCGETIGPDGKIDFNNAIRCTSVKKEHFVFMGYSMRTTRWRYTEWAKWNGTALAPIWMSDEELASPDALVELYDHEGDHGPQGAAMWDDYENENVASANKDVVTSLSARLREFYDLQHP